LITVADDGKAGGLGIEKYDGMPPEEEPYGLLLDAGLLEEAWRDLRCWALDRGNLATQAVASGCIVVGFLLLTTDDNAVRNLATFIAIMTFERYWSSELTQDPRLPSDHRLHSHGSSPLSHLTPQALSDLIYPAAASRASQLRG
jgi:hypothetical protein